MQHTCEVCGTELKYANALHWCPSGGIRGYDGSRWHKTKGEIQEYVTDTSQVPDNTKLQTKLETSPVVDSNWPSSLLDAVEGGTGPVTWH